MGPSRCRDSSEATRLDLGACYSTAIDLAFVLVLVLVPAVTVDFAAIYVSRKVHA